jgi:hypothetical protein
MSIIIKSVHNLERRKALTLHCQSDLFSSKGDKRLFNG